MAVLVQQLIGADTSAVAFSADPVSGDRDLTVVNATWGLGETGAAGPTGNRYGDPAGHTCIAVAGAVRASRTLRTHRSERLENMHAFAAAALELLEEVLKKIE